MKNKQGILSSNYLLVVSTWYQSLGFEFEDFWRICLKVAEEILFKLPNTILIIVCYNNVVHINNQIDALSRRCMMIEDRVV